MRWLYQPAASSARVISGSLKRLDCLDERPKPKVLEARGACWSPLGSVAAWVLWRLTEE